MLVLDFLVCVLISARGIRQIRTLLIRAYISTGIITLYYKHYLKPMFQGCVPLFRGKRHVGVGVRSLCAYISTRYHANLFVIKFGHHYFTLTSAQESLVCT